jgi:hypothetical protein
VRGRRFESNLTLQGKPNSHARNTNRASNRFPHIPGYGSGPPQATAGPYAHHSCRTYVCSATTKPVFLSAMQNVLPHVGACKHKIKIEWWRRVHLPGQSGTRLTTYHISRHVASTFKRLATTTTHFDLKAFTKIDRVNFQVMTQHMTLSVILIVIAE